ncbi:hypothetical protein RQP46_006060 [Phenoliferia psychrophenolica]
MNIIRYLLRPRQQPKIASFPPELIDAILEHLEPGPPKFAPGPWQADEPQPAHLHDLKSYSLVCRAWRDPVQRRIFRKLVIRTSAQAARVVDGIVATGLQVHVQTLEIISPGVYGYSFDKEAHKADRDRFEIRFEPSYDSDAGLEHFLALLLIFPRVNSLTIEPEFRTFELEGYLRLEASPSLHLLSHLRISMHPSHWSAELVHDFLALTPNLTSLSLRLCAREVHYSPNKKAPVHLPHLSNLEISGDSDLAFLSSETIDQITSLRWDDNWNGSEGFAWENTLLVLLGPNLRTLWYRLNSDRRHARDKLDLCLAVEDLTLCTYGRTTRYLSHVPPSTHTLTLPSVHDADDLLTELTAETRPTALRTVVLSEQFEKLNASMTILVPYINEVSMSCKKAGVQLMVNDEDMCRRLGKME